MIRGHRIIPARILVLAAVASALTVAACIEDPLALEADSAPGASSETRDFSVLVSELASWRDTTLSGFALRNEATFQLASNRPGRIARMLGLLDVPDTISTFADTLPVDEFSAMGVRLNIDTIRSSFDAFPVTVRMLALTRSFDPDSVSWAQAGPGEPWTTPGGDLGVEIGSGEVTALSDSIILAPSVPEDSLLKAWQASNGEHGFAIVVEGPEATVNVRQVVFRYDALLEGRSEPVGRTQFLEVRTFINDPPAPSPGTDLRVGGLPASRFYLDFQLPATLGGVPLDEAIINHAELKFIPLATPAVPYALERNVAARQVKLLGDPFVYFEKTPVGTSPLAFTSLIPDSLANGRALRLDITSLVIDAIRGGDARVRLAFRAEPDAQSLGFWDFGSVESAPALQPSLRIVLTALPNFDVPR